MNNFFIDVRNTEYTSKVAPLVETTRLVETVTPLVNTNQTTDKRQRIGKKWFYSLFNKGKVEDNYSVKI